MSHFRNFEHVVFAFIKTTQKYITKDDSNVMDVINYFEQNRDIEKLEAQCHTECYVSLGIWFTLFVSGALYQYNCHKSKKKSNNSGRAADCSYSIDPDNDRQPVIIHNHYHQLSNDDEL